MFTGLIEDVGSIQVITRRSGGAELRVRCSLALEDINLGDSIAVNGTCLTVVSKSTGTFAVELSPETFKRTNFSTAKVADQVNLELAMRLGQRMGGHLVQGHVDGLARLQKCTAMEIGWELIYELPANLLSTTIEKGSIALDGVSLTIARLHDRCVTVAVIPHTGEHTNLLGKTIGSLINVETDMIGKYVQRSIERLDVKSTEGGLTLETLKKAGLA
jgi:riboflavin synthase